MTSISLCRDTSPPYPRLLSTVCCLCCGCVHVPVSTVSTQPCSCLPATRKKRRQGTVGDPWGRGPTYSTIMGLGLRASTLAGTWDLRTCVSQQRKDMSYSHWWVPGTSHRQSVSPSILGLLMIIRPPVPSTALSLRTGVPRNDTEKLKPRTVGNLAWCQPEGGGE